MVEVDFWQQLFLTALSIFGGVLGGGYLTLQIQKKMNNDSKKDIVKITTDSIKQELEDAQEGIEEFNKNPVKWHEPNTEFRGEKPWILRPAYDSAVNSGNFNLLEKILQKEIPSAYLSIDAINFYSDQIRKFTFTPAGIQGISFTAGQLCIKITENVSKLDTKLKNLIPKL